MFQSLISALPVAERPAGMESFSLLQMTQLVAGKLILSRGPRVYLILQLL
jgi:hypothetical protein